MNRTVAIAGLIFLAFSVLLQDTALSNDTVYLKSGRILRGKITEGKAEKGGDFILLETETGAIYKLDSSDIVDTVIKRGPIDVEYKTKLRHISDTATEHVTLAKWCEKESRKRFKEQIRWHYENVIRLDPDHRVARKKLGYMMLKDGNWVAEAEFKARQGYVPDRTRGWVADLSKEVANRDESTERALGEKKKQFNRWVKSVRRDNFNVAELNALCDPASINLVYQNAIKATERGNIEFARVHLEAISTVKTQKAIRMIAHFAMMASNQSLREHAIALLSQSDMNHDLAVLTLTEGLKSTSRWIVHNSAFAIAEVASTDEYSRDHAILPLADALVTEHTERIEGALEAGRMNPSFGSGGTGLQMGGGPQTRKRLYQNQPSLDALRRLFEVDFQFNEDAWREWYIENYTLSNMDVRVDE
jgi:hypothetical protein